MRLKQYNPNTPNKHGLKVFSLLDAKTRYMLNLAMYSGQQPEGPHNVKNNAFRAVERLVIPLSGSGRNITCDSWFTVFSLINKLLTGHNLTYVGKVRKIKESYKLNSSKQKSGQWDLICLDIEQI